MRAAQISDTWSCPEKSDSSSLTIIKGELGDSDGGNCRIDIWTGVSDFANVKACGNGFRKSEGIASEGVGETDVGGSYLGIVHKEAKRRTNRNALT